MPHNRFVCSPVNPYYVRVRAHGQNLFYISQPAAWSIFNDYLELMRFAFNVQLHAIAMVPSELNFIATFPEANFSRALAYFLRNSSLVIGYETKRINHIFGPRVKRVELPSPKSFQHAYKYLHHQPKFAKHCESVGDYEFSSLQCLLGREFGPHLIDPFFNAQPVETLRWLDRSVPARNWELIRRALTKSKFSLARDPSHHGPHALETELL